MVNIADIAGIASILTPNPTLTLGKGTPTTSSTPWYERLLNWATDNPTQLGLLGGLGGGLMGLLGGGSTANQPQGYQGGIPQYTYNRQQVPYQDENRRPGSGGRRYFNDGQFVPGAAQGGDTTNPTKEQALREQNPMGKIVSYSTNKEGLHLCALEACILAEKLMVWLIVYLLQYPVDGQRSLVTESLLCPQM